ncbi:hypothetical protein CEXT_604251 [Caerostris extrusa]|uniref:Uncharacterized protein n=1 Tax=Caerostris extrusa TaxID=172846 RepID=A0AAV4TWF7_CAEEX|nr:hypothetical protein CEXT_604251 [Caerostris extrusa]
MKRGHYFVKKAKFAKGKSFHPTCLKQYLHIVRPEVIAALQLHHRVKEIVNQRNWQILEKGIRFLPSATPKINGHIMEANIPQWLYYNLLFVI